MNIARTAPIEICTQITLPLYLHSAQAGFNCPVDNDEPAIDLNELLIRNSKVTFVAYIRNDTMQGHGLEDGDLVIVDRSVKPHHGDLVVALLDEELLCRELDMRNSQLIVRNNEPLSLSLTDNADLRIEGVVTGSVRQFR